MYQIVESARVLRSSRSQCGGCEVVRLEEVGGWKVFHGTDQKGQKRPQWTPRRGMPRGGMPRGSMPRLLRREVPSNARNGTPPRPQICTERRNKTTRQRTR